MSSLLHSRIFIGVAVGVGVSVVSGLVYRHYKRVKRETIPSKWKKIGTLEEFYFFPVKSCGAIALTEAQCENLGLRQGDVIDRALMLVDKDAKLVSARAYPNMFKIVPRIVGRTKLVLSAPGMEDLYFDFSKIIDEAQGDVQAVVHGISVNVLNCGDKYHKWFSKFILNKPEGIRLVYYPHTVPTRPVDKSVRNDVFTRNDTGTLQDLSSYMLINLSSVNDLNNHLQEKIIPLQFRGNFYIKTDGPAFEEDSWQWVKIGDEAIFRQVCPCHRCIMPNINPFTAARNAQNEPLKTLKSYRISPKAPSNGPVLGVQMGLRAPGKVRLGDAVYIEDNSQ